MIDAFLSELKEKAQELSSKHWGDDERHLIGKGIQCMYVQTENIIRERMKNNGWIPCSERLPEVKISDRTKLGICSDNGQSFLITDTEGYVYESTFYAVAHKFKDDAIAWQPLPEAYHEQMD